MFHQIFKRLQGGWIFRRLINNRLSPEYSGNASGSARLMPLSDTELHYKEEGRLRIEAQSTNIPIQREDIYVYHKQDNAIDTYFSQQGKPTGFFHRLQSVEEKDAVDELIVKAEHLCGGDRYAIRYRFFGAEFNKFSIEYTVEGPKKNYTSETTFEREPQSPL